MRYLKIKEFAEVVSGSTPKTNIEEFWNGEYPWITPAEINLDTQYIYSTQRQLTEEGVKSCSLKLLKKGTVLLTSRAPIGKVAIAGVDLYCNQGFKNLICDESIVYPKYLYHWLSSKTEYLNSLGRGATFKEISKSIVEEIEIPIPSLEIQIKISNALDKAQQLIDSRKEQMQSCDELIKSQFIEMFGDPAFNKKGWEEVELSTLLRTKPSNGFFAKNNEYCDEGNAQVMWLSDVINRMYSNTENLKRVNATDKDLEKYRVQYGDLLFCRSSLNKEGIGKATAVPPYVDNVTMFECHVIRTPLDLDRCVPEFMQIQTTLDYFRNQVLSNSKTATMTTIGQDGIVSTKVIVPPLHLQKEFALFIKKTNKLKFEMEQSLVELENNFNSLMQRAFKGELF